MESNKSLHPKARLSSFGYAIRGLKNLVRSEPNAKIHLIATIAVIIGGFIRHLTVAGWISIIIAIAMVWITEALNTAIEVLCDYACKGETHPAIKLAKDVAAGAVLVASVAAVAIGALIFLG